MVNMVSSVTTSYSASPPSACSVRLECVLGESQLFWFEQHKCKSLKNVKPSGEAVFGKGEELRIKSGENGK